MGDGQDAVSGPAGGAGGDQWSSIQGSDRVAQAAAKLARLGNSPSERAARERYMAMLAPKSGEIILDVGAGAGVITAEIAQKVAPGGRVFAVDPSPGLLEAARNVTREAGIGHLVDTRVADGRDLPFGLSAFDAAFCRWVLLHVDGPERVIAEMRRVTRRGGRVLAVEVDWETAMVHPGDRLLTRRILNHSADRSIDPWIGRRLPTLFQGQGFADVTVEVMVTRDEGGGDRAWLEYLFERAALAVSAGIASRDEAVRWMAALDDGFNNRNFLFGMTQFAVLGRVPG